MFFKYQVYFKNLFVIIIKNNIRGIYMKFFKFILNIFSKKKLIKNNNIIEKSTKEIIWHTRYEWPVDCFDKIKIEIELVTGKYIICYTCGYGFTNINDNFVSYGIIWVKRWRFLGKEKKIKNI